MKIIKNQIRYGQSAKTLTVFLTDRKFHWISGRIKIALKDG